MSGQDTTESSNPVVAVARSKRNPDEPIVLSTGIRAKLHPVAAGLLNDATSRLKPPRVPTVQDEDRPGRYIENPDDPEYQEQLETFEQRRNQVTIDAIIMFGVELVGDIPARETWLPKLRFLEKRGSLDLSDFDLDDPLDLEFIYKRYIAVGAEDISEIVGVASLSPEAMTKAEAQF